MDACQELVLGYELEGGDLLECIVSGDESWIVHQQPETERVPFQLTETQKIPDTGICGENDADAFWDDQGPLVEHHTSKWAVVTRVSYCDLLWNRLRTAISL